MKFRRATQLNQNMKPPRMTSFPILFISEWVLSRALIPQQILYLEDF